MFERLQKHHDDKNFAFQKSLYTDYGWQGSFNNKIRFTPEESDRIDKSQLYVSARRGAPPVQLNGKAHFTGKIEAIVCRQLATQFFWDSLTDAQGKGKVGMTPYGDVKSITEHVPIENERNPSLTPPHQKQRNIANLAFNNPLI